VDQVLLPLKVEKLWGVGKKTTERLHAKRIFTVSDLRRTSPEELNSILGSMGTFLWDLAHGRDDREVDHDGESKSCGTERTFNQDLLSVIQLSDVLEELCQEIAQRLRENKWLALTFTLKVKYFDFKQVTRSFTFGIPTDTPEGVYLKLRELLLAKTEAGRTPIRLLGVSASSLIRENDPLQLYFEFMKI
jgi:DNA polymerase-4